MKINLYDIHYYFLSFKNEKRRKHILSEFKNFKLTEIDNSMCDIGKFKSGALGFIRILDLACQNQQFNKPFEPFVIIEDDAKKNCDFPREVEIPDNSDLLYIGLSRWGIKDNRGVLDIYYKNINKNIIKIYNMLSTHGIMITSIRGLLSFQKCLQESYFENIHWDIIPSQMQPFLNIYALKKPLVYQYGKLGGEEYETNINLENLEDRILPECNFNKTILTYHMLYKKKWEYN